MDRWAITQQPKNDRRGVLAIGSTWDAPVLAAGSSMPITETPDVVIDGPDRSHRFGLLDYDVPVMRKSA
jgi:hypothetical protein